jgi:YVTN family beta-propeller protein
MELVKHCVFIIIAMTSLCFADTLIQKNNQLAGMPVVKDINNIYADTNSGMLSPVAQRAMPRVYVPNSVDNTVSIIDPTTYRVIETFKTGKNPQHIVPSYDLKTLWVLNDLDNSVTPIDPNTAKPGTKIRVEDPYNLYFTPDGQFAIVVDEARKRLDFRDPQTMALHDSTPIDCKGINHMEFTVDGRYLIATCEYSGQLVKIDVATHKVLSYLTLTLVYPQIPSMPQDIRSSPNGRIFYVADMMTNGVFLIDPINFRQLDFIPTGVGTHSVYPSRNGRLLYVANRGCMAHACNPKGPGSISVIDPFKQKVVATWPIPGGGSPDMGNLSADGKELWLSGRYDREVYVFDTQTGILKHRIPVGKGPHGLTVWPQPGRYSLGHTGNMR